MIIFAMKHESTEKKSGYNYSAQDISIFDVLVLSKVLPKLSNITPWGLPANIITIFSNTCVFIAFIIAMLSVKGIYTLWFAIPFLLIAYLIGDALDGVQARKTKTGSPLGEFMDHFLDCFVNAELFIPFLVCYKAANPYLIFLVLVKAYITQAAAFWERYKNGHMYFGRFSTSETIIGLALIITVSYFSGIVDFCGRTLGSFEFISNAVSSQFLLNFTILDVVIVIFILGALSSDIFNFVRTKGASLRFWSYCVSALLVGFLFAVQNVDFYYIPYYIVALFNIDFISNLIVSITMKKTDPHPDYVFVGFAVVMFCLKITAPWVLIVELCFLSLKVLIRAVSFISKHKNYWYWKNPAPVEE